MKTFLAIFMAAVTGIALGAEIAQSPSEAMKKEAENYDREGYHSRDWGGDDSEILAQVAMYYAQAKDIKTKMLVILVTLNRVWSDEFEDATIEEAAQTLTSGCYKTMDPDYECYDAVGHVQYDGWDESEGALYFVPTVDMYDVGNEKLFEYGGYSFYK